MKNGNFVAKYDWRVNKAKVFKDRKKAMKRGESKYKTIKVEKGYSNDAKGSYKLPFKFFNLF